MNDEETRAEPDVRQLAEALALCQDPALVEDFLRSLLTPRELADVATRWELVGRIASGTSQRQISRELGISLCKITRGSKELKKDDSPFLKMIKLVQEE